MKSCIPKSYLCLSRIPQRKKCEHMQKTWSEHAKNHDPNMQEVGFYEAAQNFVYQIYSKV